MNTIPHPAEDLPPLPKPQATKKTPAQEARRVVQFGATANRLFALANDGSVWTLSPTNLGLGIWMQLPSLPPGTPGV